MTEKLDEVKKDWLTPFEFDLINDWEEGSKKTWDEHWLGNCTRFIPIKGMKCKFDVRRDSNSNLSCCSGTFRDPLRMCKLTATFGSRTLPSNRTNWEWRGPKTIWNTDIKGAIYYPPNERPRNITKEMEAKNWFEMQRI